MDKELAEAISEFTRTFSEEYTKHMITKQKLEVLKRVMGVAETAIEASRSYDEMAAYKELLEIIFGEDA